MSFVVTGGGTGGHIYPALAIARGLQDRFGSKVFYIGGTLGLEAEIIPAEGFPFRGIPLAGLKRGLSPSNILAIWLAGAGILKAYRYLKQIRPAVVVGTGGYVCGPVVLAAALSGIPTMIHEQNALPGITNRILSRFVGGVALTFEDSRKYFPLRNFVKVTGLPVRKDIFSKSKKQAREKLGLPPNGMLILSFGGSQGARSINNAMRLALKHFSGRKDIFFFHVAGPNNYDKFLNDLKEKGINMDNCGNITITSYMHDMPSVLAAADLLISRAGATTLAEMTAVGLPAILVPYPYAAENHQEYNARSVEKRGAAVVVKDSNLSGDFLVTQIEKLISCPQVLEEMTKASKELGRPDAVDGILDCVQYLLDNKRK